MNYHVAEASSAYQLAATVSNLMQCGWHPIGGVSVMSGSGWQRYTQALVKQPAYQLMPTVPLAMPLAG